MEYKYILIITSTFFVFMVSIIIAKSNEQQLAQDPITSFYDLQANSIDGKVVDMKGYKGKKILIVNVASQCGLTPQYAELEELSRLYPENLVVLGFPSNQFLKQEPGSNKDIAKFCSSKYSITFPLFEKSIVKGQGKNIVYDWLTDPKKNGWNSKPPSWNFSKYLIDENGKLIKRFSARTTPLSEEIISSINP